MTAVNWSLACAVALSAMSAIGGAQPPGHTQEALSLQRAPGTIAGTLLLPRVSGPVPVVLIIAGSGPSDRDGNGGGVKAAPLKQLAESLLDRQIASLRYDKRGIGGSATAAIPEHELRFETLAEDAAAWVARLASDPRFSRVIVAGHSEGALLGLLAIKGGPAAGYISLAGPARPIDEVLHDQLAATLPAPLAKQSDSVLVQLRAGRTVVAYPAPLEALFRLSVQPYLISLLRYSGQTELAAVRLPCLIVQGTTDLQVEPREAELLAKANPRCAMASVAGMNHVFKSAPPGRAAQMSTYLTPDPPLAHGLVDAVAQFILSLK